MKPASKASQLPSMVKTCVYGFIMLSLVGGHSAYADEPGILDNFQSGLPIAIWSDDQTADAVKAIHDSAVSDQPAVNRLRNAVVLAKSSPSLSEVNRNALGAARIEYLYDAGALDQAEALAALYPSDHPAIQPILENISILSDRPTNYCMALDEELIAPVEQGMDIYCLLRDDRYDDAVAIFQSSQYPAERQMALARYLDLDNPTDPARNAPWTSLPDPFPFVLDEALGRPRGNDRLPPAYLYYSRSLGSAPRAHLEATEKLVKTAALPPNILIYEYRQRKSAESGGVWGRAEIIQSLDAMNPEEPNDTLDKLLPIAFDRFDEARLLQVFAQEASQWLSGIPMRAIENDDTRLAIIRLGLLGGWSQPSWREWINHTDDAMMVAHQIRHPFGDNVPPNPSAPSTVKTLYDAFFDGSRPSTVPPTGLRLWRALEILDHYRDQNDATISSALKTLDGLGQRQTAADIATEILLTSGNNG